MKFRLFLLAFLLSPVAMAEVKWSYEGGVLTQLDAPEGKTPWAFNLTAAGVLTKKTIGTGPVLDLREETLPSGVTITGSFPRLVNGGVTTCEEVYLPDTITQLNGNSQYTFYGWSNLKVVRLPAGLTKIPDGTFGNLSSLRQVDIYGGAQDLKASFYNNKSLTNVVFHQSCTVALPGGCFHSCSALREITWNGWFTYTKVPASGSTVFWTWTDKQCRFLVPYNDIGWYKFYRDEVTPWDQCSAADKSAYFTKYGSDAAVPAGISVSTYSVGGLPKTYIVRGAKPTDKFKFAAETANPSCSSVTVNPAPDADGNYDKNQIVTVSLQVDAGAEFRGWTGDVAAEDKMKTTLQVTVDDIKYIKANVVSGTFTYDTSAGTITDGEQVIHVSANATGLTAGLVSVHRADGVLDLSKPIVSGETITEIPASWAANAGVASWITEIRLPETVTTIGNAAFYNCLLLERIVPFLPHAVTSFGATAVEYCYKLESDFEIGFATNALGETVPTTIGAGWGLYQTYKMLSAKFGPGISSLPEQFLTASNLKYIEFGQNFTNLNRVIPYDTTRGMLTNAVIRCTNEVILAANVFQNQTQLREVNWSGWYTVKAGVNPFSGWTDLQCRFIVPGDSLKWRSFLSSPDNVTPWAECSASDKTTYATRYGAEAKAPYGITKAVSGGLPRTYVVQTDAELSTRTLAVSMSYPDSATVTFDPQPDEYGAYEKGTEVTVTLTPKAGVVFRSWTGDVPAEQVSNAVLVLTMDTAKTIRAKIVSDTFHYDSEAKTILDGEQTISVTKSDAGLTLGAVSGYRTDNVLDLRKPIDSGDVIVAIPANWAADSGVKTWATDIYLPETLTTVGNNAFYQDTVVRRIIPMFPASVTNVGSECLRACSNLVSPFEVGYGVDAEGNPLPTKLPTSGWLLYTSYSISALRFGPGVKSLGVTSQCYANTSVRFVEFAPDLTTIAPLPHPQSGKGVTNAVFHQTATLALPGGMFWGQTELKEISWNGWFTYTPTPVASGDTVFYQWTDKQCRFLVPGDHPDWVTNILDSTKVTPWNTLSESVRNEYYAKYGADAAQPEGLSVAVSGGLPKTWIVLKPCGFTIGEIEPQTWGSRPVPVLRDASGNVLPSADFDYAYLNVASPGVAVVTVSGKAGTAFAGKSAFATFIQSARTVSDTFTWTAAADGAFEDDANWTSASGDPGHPELPGDVAILPTFADDASYSVTVSRRLMIKSLTVGDTAAVGGAGQAKLVFGTVDARNTFSQDVCVKANGVITHVGPANVQKDVVYLDVGGNMTVEAGGVVTATARGCNANQGKGRSVNLNFTSSGYAGYGHTDSANDCDVKAHGDFRNTAYGSVFRPTDWGSGGNAGSVAGGAIRLVVAGTLTVNGTIEADGYEATSILDYSGTGGSVWITCGQIVGTGFVTAMEGAKNASWGCGVRGSGGRVAIYETVAKDFAAFPRSHIAVARVTGGAVGTVYLEHADAKRTGGWLYIDAGVQTRHRVPIPMADDGDPMTAYANVNVVVKGGAVFSVEADTKVRDLMVKASDDGTLKPYVFLNGNTLSVQYSTHEGGKRWFMSYARAIEEGWVDLGGTDAAPGKVVWLGDFTGCFLFVR